MHMQVRDQLALLQYLQGRFAEAKKNAVLSLAAVRGAGVDGDGEGGMAEAMCSLRLGIISLGNPSLARCNHPPPPSHPSFQPNSMPMSFLLARLTLHVASHMARSRHGS